jgi:hypothetical protein
MSIATAPRDIGRKGGPELYVYRVGTLINANQESRPEAPQNGLLQKRSDMLTSIFDVTPQYGAS